MPRMDDDLDYDLTGYDSVAGCVLCSKDPRTHHHTTEEWSEWERRMADRSG